MILLEVNTTANCESRSSCYFFEHLANKWLFRCIMFWGGWFFSNRWLKWTLSLSLTHTDLHIHTLTHLLSCEFIYFYCLYKWGFVQIPSALVQSSMPLKIFYGSFSPAWKTVSTPMCRYWCICPAFLKKKVPNLKYFLSNRMKKGVGIFII
jgi:hypothetical protein